MLHMQVVCDAVPCGHIQAAAAGVGRRGLCVPSSELEPSMLATCCAAAGGGNRLDMPALLAVAEEQLVDFLQRLLRPKEGQSRKSSNPQSFSMAMDLTPVWSQSPVQVEQAIYWLVSGWRATSEGWQKLGELLQLSAVDSSLRVFVTHCSRTFFLALRSC